MNEERPKTCDVCHEPIEGAEVAPKAIYEDRLEPGDDGLDRKSIVMRVVHRHERCRPNRF